MGLEHLPPLLKDQGCQTEMDQGCQTDNGLCSTCSPRTLPSAKQQDTPRKSRSKDILWTWPGEHSHE